MAKGLNIYVHIRVNINREYSRAALDSVAACCCLRCRIGGIKTLGMPKDGVETCRKLWLGVLTTKLYTSSEAHFRPIQIQIPQTSSWGRRIHISSQQTLFSPFHHSFYTGKQLLTYTYHLHLQCLHLRHYPNPGSLTRQKRPEQWNGSSRLVHPSERHLQEG